MKLALLLFFVSAACAVCPQDRSGLTLFSQNSAWMTPGATVNIPSGTNVLLDTNANVSSITVSGDLVFKNSNIQLATGYILIKAGGGLYIGSTDNGCAITSKITITLVGERQPVSVSQMGSDPFDGTLLGSKGIAAATGSTISIVGDVPSITWTNLRGTVQSGASQIVVESSVSWKVGDEIVIATTDFSQTISWYNGAPSSLWYQMGRGAPDQNEVRTINGVSSNGATTTISLDTPLAFTHWGVEYERAEVGVLTRNIVLQGDSATSAYGGHIMVRKALSANIIGAELVNFGQRGNLGRYPIHFHLTKDSYGLGYTVSSNSLRDGFQRCIVMHYSNGVMMENNVAYNNTGHCYFLEDGSERGNTFNHNLGIKTAAVASEDPLIILPTDQMPSMFWITNPNNTFTNNAAVEATFGYWFSMPSSPTGISAGDFAPGDAWVRPRNTPLKVFDNNVAHSNRRNGIHIDDMVVPGPLTTELAGYSPLQGPYTSDTQSYNTPNIQANFDGMLIYKNREHGVWARGGPFQWTNLVAADNLRAFNCPPAPSVLTDSLIIGETSNIGTPMAAELGRSRPDPWNNNALVKGWETYDNSGAQYVKSTTFVNFTSSSIRPAAAISGLECAPFLMQSRDRSRNLTLIDSNPTWNNECDYGDSGYGWSFFDVDGSLTGSPSWIVSNNSLMYDNTCIWKPEWNQYSCPPFKEGSYLQFIITVDSSKTYGAEFGNEYGYDSGNRRNNTRFSVYPLGSDGSLLSGYHGVGATTYGDGTPKWFMSANFKPRRGYAVRFDQNKPTPPSMSLTMQSCVVGDWAYLAIPYPASYFPLTITGSQYGPSSTLTQVNSLAELKFRNQYYYDSSSSNLYIRFDCVQDSTTDYWGFTDRNGYEGWTIQIVSGCSSGTCATPSASAVAIPPVIQNMFPYEDQYVATMQSCQSTTGSTTGAGVAYFYFNPVTAVLNYKVVHDLTNIVTKVTINRGAVKESGNELFELVSFDAPITGVASLTRLDWIDLLKGNLYITVATTQNSEHIRGQIACVGQCTLPPSATTLDACSQASYGANSFPIFTDNWTPNMAYPNANGNAGDKYNTTIAVSSDVKLCGNGSLAATIGNAAFGVYIPNGGLNISATTQSYMQFWARLANGQRSETFRIQFLSTADGNPIINPTDANNLIPSQYIDNLVISDEAWTRVRVPMSYFNFVDPMPKAYYFFVTRKSWNPQQDAVTLYIDEWRFTGPIQDQTTQGVATSDIVHPTSICVSAPPSGGAISAGGSSSSQSSSNGSGGKTSTGDGLTPDMASASSIIVSYAVIAIAIISVLM